jgi:hypothetical protein
MDVHKQTPDEVIDMVGLHINYVIRMNDDDNKSSGTRDNCLIAESNTNIREYQQITEFQKDEKDPQRIQVMVFFFDHPY